MDSLINQLGSDRITARQIDELVGLARGIAADGDLNQAEVEFLQKWLAANTVVSDQPVIRTLYARIQASAWRDDGSAISIVSEEHWTAHL
ncbi:hypothetical protein GCM10017620_30030 [Brevundimonas intermedia]|uniref:Uncharacterized protein n=1 Tax=Brevundimonas intermedia TaxID=74315 RepID=A0ABQ5TB39_9CAUL|nr:hypothetical protein [Brevundimonas intermedia]GLK50029.1 hypothetical protein GCM10017620_30030 [Brevundimonas intermedia]